MKTVRILVLVVGATALAFAAACTYGWVYEKAFTEQRLESIDRANEAMHNGEKDPNRHIIRPPETDPSYYK